MDLLRSQFSRLRQSLPQPQQMPGNYPSSPRQELSWYVQVSKQVNYILITPLALCVRALMSVLSLLFKTLYVLDKPRESSSDVRATSALLNDPIRRAEQFVAELEENLPITQQQQPSFPGQAVTNLPPFFQGSYSLALYMANTRAKFLFVYLTNSHTEGSKSLFEKVITNKKFNELVSDTEKTIIWGGDVAQAEAYQLATNLNISKFPMLGLLCLTRATKMTPEGPTKEAARISLVLKIQGGIRDSADVGALIHSKFVKKMMRYEPELALIRAELRERLAEEQLRRTQQENFQKSLQQDKLKKMRKEKEELLVKYLKWRQPHILRIVAGEATSPTLRVAFKFENGQRVTLNFSQESSIEDLFTYVELSIRNMLNSHYEVLLSDEEAQSLFNKQARDYKCRLTSSVPPRSSLNEYPLTTLVKDVPFITPSGLLMVESMEDN
ncbi:hypothetical protein PUMCH_001809 [Australozyma saopauloensis]|uniref:UBX domain-containing protein n=1 Tax=Australozyma saopauloensis TaxID=291208 RepID=A0AAX4H7J1_9ASCO|nr:hypothetical protein PUMCH_001809 [[Candida] saopauloensis]